MRTFSSKNPRLLSPSRSSPPTAFAHAQLEKATPPVGGTVASAKRNPPHVQRGRRAEILEGFADRPGRRCVPLGAAKTEPSNQAVLIVPIAKPLAAGLTKCTGRRCRSTRITPRERSNSR